MASNYSTNLKIELIATGEQAGTWGDTTNTNLGTALEEAIVGRAEISMSSTSVTLTNSNSNSAQDFRALYLDLSGSPGGAAVLNVPAIQKNYIVYNGSDQQVTIKVSGLTGVAIPVGKTVVVYNNGSDVVSQITHIPTLDVATLTATAATLTSSAISGGTISGITQMDVAGTSGAGAQIKLYEDDDSANDYYVAIKAPNTITTGNFTLTAPDTVNDTLAVLGTEQTFSAKQIFTNTVKVQQGLEKITVDATAATGTINYDALTQAIVYYTTDASGDWTLNIRGDGSNSLNSIMADGESLTVVFMATIGTTEYRNDVVQIDSTVVNPKWQGGAAPGSGNPSSVDVYAYVVVKTGDATFTVFASQTQFA
mgnify:CR=1 FL=1